MLSAWLSAEINSSTGLDRDEFRWCTGGSNQAASATGFAFILDGEVRVSLPKGHYTLYADALRLTSDTPAEERIVTQPQLQVTGQRNQIVGIDFRTATAQPSLTVPQPSLTVPQPTAAKDYTIATTASGRTRASSDSPEAMRAASSASRRFQRRRSAPRRWSRCCGLPRRAAPPSSTRRRSSRTARSAPTSPTS